MKMIYHNVMKKTQNWAVSPPRPMMFRHIFHGKTQEHKNHLKCEAHYDIAMMEQGVIMQRTSNNNRKNIEIKETQ